MLRYLYLLLLSCFVNLTVHAATIDLPDIGDNAGAVSPAEEFRTGQSVIRNIRQANGIMDDPLLQDYLNEIGFRLVAPADSNQAFHFFLIKDQAINAFALPGGFIGINAGLILASKTESELAGVMAHEIAHVTQRHYARRFEQNAGSIPVIAAMIAAIILGGQNQDVGQAVLASAAASSAQKQINFTRAHEKEADRIGINLLIQAGFNPQGMVAFFETMDKQSRLYGDSIPEFLRTHPVNPARITDARHRANQVTAQNTGSTLSYYLLRARLQVLSSEQPEQLLVRFQRQLQDGNYLNREATQYGYALSLLINKKYTLAKQQIGQLLKQRPDSISYNILHAETETAAGQYPAAIRTFNRLLSLYPDNPSINLYYVKTLMAADKMQQANRILNRQIKLNPHSPELYRLLARTQAALKQPASSHFSQAEYYFLQGQTHSAIKQLELGLALAKNNFYLTTRMEARLHDLKNELQQLARHSSSP